MGQPLSILPCDTSQYIHDRIIYQRNKVSYRKKNNFCSVLTFSSYPGLQRLELLHRGAIQGKFRASYQEANLISKKPNNSTLKTLRFNKIWIPPSQKRPVFNSTPLNDEDQQLKQSKSTWKIPKCQKAFFLYSAEYSGTIKFTISGTLLFSQNKRQFSSGEVSLYNWKLWLLSGGKS